MKTVRIVHKICLVGAPAAGKTSLVRRFVLDQFDDNYLITMGAKVTKKNLSFKSPQPQDDVNLTMLIWDIMGQKDFAKDTHFYGTNGALAVCDLTRMDTLDKLENWIESLYAISGQVPIVVLGNKSDLKDSIKVTPEDLEDFTSDFADAPVLLTSAKTGENVEKAFYTLGKFLSQGLNE